MKRVFLENVLKTCGKTCELCRKLRKSVRISETVRTFLRFSIFSYPFRHMFWSGSEKSLLWTNTTTGPAKG